MSENSKAKIETPQIDWQTGKITNQIKQLQETVQDLSDRLYRMQQNIAYGFHVMAHHKMVSINETGYVKLTEDPQ